ncbi:MAG: methyltransferase domain-containing protein [Pseudomonadota bacterium]
MGTAFWLCTLVAVAIAAALLLWEISVWTVIIALIALACPAMMLYSRWIMRRALAALDERAPPHTHGVTMSWAAPFYDLYCPWLGLGPGFRRETLHHAGLRSGEHVLDVGCGTGVLTRLAAATVGSAGYVVGIDPSPGMLAKARRNATGTPVEFRLGAIEALPFHDASFDLVLSSFMMHHLPPEVKRAGLAEVYRVLKPGGRLLVVDIDKPSNPLWWLLCWPLLFFHFTATNLRGEVPAYLRAAGFAPVERCARKGGLLSFWRARKPDRSE